MLIELLYMLYYVYTVLYYFPNLCIYGCIEFNVEHMTEIVSWTEEWRILSLADAAPKMVDEQVVLLSQVIAHDCNIGYEQYHNMILKSYNSQPVSNIKQLKQLLLSTDPPPQPHHIAEAGAKGLATDLVPNKLPLTPTPQLQKDKEEVVEQSQLVFEFINGQVIALDRAAAIQAQEQVCSIYPQCMTVFFYVYILILLYIYIYILDMQGALHPLAVFSRLAIVV